MHSVFPFSTAFQNAVRFSVFLNTFSLNHSWICNLYTSLTSLLGIISLYAPVSVTPACVKYPVVNKTLHKLSILVSISSYVNSNRINFSIGSPAIRRSISSRVVLFALSIKHFTSSLLLVFNQYDCGFASGSLHSLSTWLITSQGQKISASPNR